MKWYLRVLRNYAVFKGRARRKEYWSFVFLNMFFGWAMALLATLLGILINPSSLGSSDERTQMVAISSSLGMIVYGLFVLIPSVAVAVRRMHDTGRNGWWIFVPLANLIFLCRRGQPHENPYGPDPLTTEPLRRVARAA